MWKGNIIEDLERGLLNYKVVGEFLADFKEEFSREDKEVNKIAELKRLEQESKMIEEFLQKFKRVARESKYKEQLLIEDFKYGINSTIKQRLMKSEYQPELINQ